MLSAGRYVNLPRAWVMDDALKRESQRGCSTNKPQPLNKRLFLSPIPHYHTLTKQTTPAKHPLKSPPTLPSNSPNPNVYKYEQSVNLYLYILTIALICDNMVEVKDGTSFVITIYM